MHYSNHLWAIVLAGGQGRRLQQFLQRQGHQHPIKQFCAVTGRRTMLQHTWERVERLVPRERVVTVLDQAHVTMFPAQLGSRAPRTVIAQPANRETAPETLLPLAYILRTDPSAIVGLFPSDHFLQPEGRFMAYVRLAEMSVQSGLQEVVVLGVESRRPDSGYGWIELNRTGRLPGSCLLPVKRFWEKPSATMAGSLHVDGHLWSTMVTVARAATLWDLIVDAVPELRRPFERIRQALGTPDEAATIQQAYAEAPCVSLSKSVFERVPHRLGAVTVRGVYWSDWGCEERVRETWRWLADNAAAAQRNEGQFCVDWAVTALPGSTLHAPGALSGFNPSIDSGDMTP